MRFIETKIPDHREKSYVDIDKAYKLCVVLNKNNKYRVRAFFLTSQSVNKENVMYPVFVELREFEKEKQGLLWIRKLLGNWLEKEE